MLLYCIYAYITIGPKVVLFPKELSHYGLDVNLLAKVYNQVKFEKKGPISWKLKGIPEIGCYENLHNFLKHWPEICSASKVELGKFYIAIDKSLQEKKMRPDNAHRFVEKLVTSSLPRNAVVNHNIEKGTTVKVLESELKQCNEQIQKLTEDFAAMKVQLEDTKLLLRMLFQLQLILIPILSLRQRLVVGSTPLVFESYIILFWQTKYHQLKYII